MQRTVKEWMGNKWLPMIAAVSFIGAMLLADWVGVSAKLSPFYSKPLATLATINVLAMGAVSGLLVYWMVWVLPRTDLMPEPGTVHWYEEQRLRLGCMWMGVFVFVFGGGLGSLSA